MRRTIIAGLLAIGLLPAAVNAAPRSHDHGGGRSNHSEVRHERYERSYERHRGDHYDRAPEEDRYVRRDYDHVVHGRSYHHVVDHGAHRHVRRHVHHDHD